MLIKSCCRTCFFYEIGICTCCWSEHYSEYRTDTDDCETWEPGHETENDCYEDK